MQARSNGRVSWGNLLTVARGVFSDTLLMDPTILVLVFWFGLAWLGLLLRDLHKFLSSQWHMKFEWQWATGTSGAFLPMLVCFGSGCVVIL
jgi:hypothetical protein